MVANAKCHSPCFCKSKSRFSVQQTQKSFSMMVLATPRAALSHRSVGHSQLWARCAKIVQRSAHASLRERWAKMKFATAATVALLGTALIAAPMRQASAYGPFCGPFLPLCLVGAIVTGAAVVATAPFALAGAAFAGPGYYPPPPPGYYPPAYYPPPAQPYYPPPGYYYPPQRPYYGN